MDRTQALQQGAGRAMQGGAQFPGPPGGMPGGGRGGMFFLGPLGGIAGVVLLVITYAVLAFALWKLLSRAGLTPAVALLMLVPVVNLGVVLWVAFTEWPALKEVARLKELVATYEMRAGTQSTSTEAPPAPPAPA